VSARRPRSSSWTHFHVLAWAIKALDKMRVRTRIKGGITDRQAVGGKQKPARSEHRVAFGLNAIAHTDKMLYRAYPLKERLREVFRVKGTRDAS
jgi:transposase